MPSRLRLLLAVVTTSLLLSACGTSLHQAPVEDRNPPPPKPAASASETAAIPTAATPDVKLLPGAENAGKPGYYTVKPGDKLIRIALDNGQGYRDLARWNALENPDRIEVGQVGLQPRGLRQRAARSHGLRHAGRRDQHLGYPGSDR